MRTISKYEYLRTAQNFHWAKKEHFILWFTGELKRHKRTEVMLPRLVKKNKLIQKRHGKRYIYTVPRRKNDTNYEHGLGCTEALVRFMVSRPDCEVIPERHLRGFGICPEWGLRYPAILLLLEFCTADNFNRKGVMKSKITRYRNCVYLIDEKFKSEPIVLFVVDDTEANLKRFVSDNETDGPMFYFTTYQTFKQVEYGDQINSPIYIWGEDGKDYSLA